MSENLKILAEQYNLKGLGVGLIVGFILEVFLIRNNKGHISFITTVMSIIAMGLMGWLAYDIAICSFPLSSWKPTIWTVGITANTWWFSRFAISGQMFKIFTELIIPEKILKVVRRAQDEEGQAKESNK